MARALEFDHIVVGGGSAGCVVAARLAQRGLSVLLLEAGPVDRSPLLAIPGAVAFAASNPRFNWSYETARQPQLNDRRLYLSQARVLGGGSSINGMVYTRGFPQEYDAWRAEGCEAWAFEDVLPYFRRSEANARGAGRRHGDVGELRVSRGRSSLPICDLILQAAGQAGHVLTDDFAECNDAAFGYFDCTIADGRRASASRSFLGHSRHPANLTVLTSALAQRVVVERGRASGVAFRRDGADQVARCRGEVILAGGAVNTPKLLMLSGIGPADHLRSLDMSVQLDQPNVGRNLQNHLLYKLAYATREPITGYRYLNPVNGALASAKYAFQRQGFFAEGSAPVGGFFRSGDDQAAPDMQLMAVPAVSGLLGQGIRALLPSQHGFSLFVSLGRPQSRGEVTLRSADPADPPIIDPRYLEAPGDLDRLVRGVRQMRRLAAQSALSRTIIGPLGPGAAVADDDQALREGVREFATNQFHVAGTCRMGASAASSVVDAQLRVHGVKGLRVADASVIPTLMNGNTNAPVMMIAERAAEFVVQAVA
jgi:choline dehydrogenase